MTPDERALIDGLFDRMRNVEASPRDPEAEALINQRIVQSPYASYALVQSVLVQDHALQQAYARVQALEAELQEANARAQEAQMRAESAAQPASGGFLGGLLGGGGRSSVPSAGSRQPVGNPQAAAQGNGPMGAPGGAGGGFPPRGPAPNQPYGGQNFAGGQQPGAPSGPWGQQARGPMGGPMGGGGGGFLQNAMATAAGVAGGALLFSGIQSMMSGGSGPIAQQAAAEKGAANADAQTAAAAPAPDATPATDTADAGSDWNAQPQQASWEDNGGWDDGGFDDGGDWA